MKMEWLSLGDNTDLEPSLQIKTSKANSKEYLVEREKLFH